MPFSKETYAVSFMRFLGICPPGFEGLGQRVEPLDPSPYEGGWDKPEQPKALVEHPNFPLDIAMESIVTAGHSCGSAFLVRWLGEAKRKIFKLILVAPWKIPAKNDKFRRAFYTYPIDESIKSRAKEIVMFTADDEENEGKESLKIFHNALGGEVIELKGHGHYILGDMGTEEFPELLEVILK